MTASPLAAMPAHRRRSPVARFIRAEPMGALALVILVVLAVAAVGARWIAPHDPLAIDFAAMLAPPSADHWFGTDSFGRDLFSRVLYGASTALLIGVLASLLGCAVGALVGVVSAYFGGRVDQVVQRIVDMFLAFPVIVLALVVVAMLGRTQVAGVDINVVLAIAIPIAPKVARVIRASALAVRVLPFIDAARIGGFSASRIVLRHMLPNVVAPLLILLTAYMAQAILLEASLSFLGLGVTEPTPAWGLMLANSAGFYREAPWLVIYPGLAICLTVLAVSLFGDSLRNQLDPRLRP